MTVLSLAFLAPLLGLLSIAYLVRCLRSRLARVPGPWYSLFTGVVLKWHELHGKRTSYIHGLHLWFGPTVRIAPNEVAFASGDAVKEIYCSGGSGYDKTEFYDLFKVYGRRTMFTTLNKDHHARRRRVLADRYANTNVMRPPSIGGIQKRSLDFLELCNGSVGGSLDLYVNWYVYNQPRLLSTLIHHGQLSLTPDQALHAYAFDCVTHHLFHPFGANSLVHKQDEQIMREVTFDSSLQNRLLKHYSPTLHALVGKFLALLAKPRETPLADEFVLQNSAKADASSFTLLSHMHEKSESGYDLERLDIAAECLDHMAAGIDTTGDVLCFLMWELSLPSSARIQERLREELEANPDTPFDKLPFLDAVIQEGLRCFPAIPMSLPRYAPRGGRNIDGYFIPEGAIVSCQAYSVHRVNQDVFPEPEAFNPDRWLEAEGDVARKRHLFAFASGGRGCVGKHLAMAEMKVLLRDIYSRFSTAPDPTMTTESMAMSDQLISSRPRGQKCLLRFTPLEKGQFVQSCVSTS